ncbi:hypothetical protein BJY04DRAFT_232278 [Aspergillus karnatakaensis]|uniref:Zn(II)2Cys6 transcription factor domain-containing protein n=1 Tax=Aspergillus karnatakaensis TaxID=1810916 RepID=UPI003CCD4466
MPQPLLGRESEKTRKIRRAHTGCRPCRRRGKKCDEAKPSCGACVRLEYACSYGVDFSFRNVDSKSYQRCSDIKIPPPQFKTQPDAIMRSSPDLHLQTVSQLNADSNLEVHYMDHFQRHVLHLIPASSLCFTEQALQSHHVRAAALCISASNISMLNAQVQIRKPSSDSRRLVSSPIVSNMHHMQARKYHSQALRYCYNGDFCNAVYDPPGVLTTLVLLAYYHHASTSHLHFRHAVWATLFYVARNRDSLTSSVEGISALQMWYRLCVSHRLGKPPALLLEGEGESTFGPNRYPDSFEHVYLGCIMGLSSNDLIYDILIKTIEIRTRIVVFRAVAGQHGISETDRGVSTVAHDLLSRLLRNEETVEADIEAAHISVRGWHLLGLLDVQRQRLGVWKSRLTHEWPTLATFPTHRDTMNALYSYLCELILTEVLLQFSLIYKSTAAFSYIMDELWPELERKARGYEHSHYPTHLAKRTINLLADYWADGSEVIFVMPAVSEEVAKAKLLDIYEPVDIVVCGFEYKEDAQLVGRWFVEKVALP